MWVRIDDAFPQHPKVVGLSDRAFRVYVEGLCYAARYLTDGYLPRGWSDRDAAAAGELREAGLWIADEGGTVVHDYLDWNPVSDTVRERAAQRHAAKSRGGQARAAVAPRDPSGRYRPAEPSAHASAPAQPADAPADAPAGHPAGSQQPASPVPVPVPVPKQREAKRVSLRVGDIQMYLLARLAKHDPRWAAVTPGALVKLAKEYGMDNVTTALGYCREDLPDGVKNPYAYLRQVTATVRKERGTL